jgi:hypothetical protein
VTSKEADLSIRVRGNYTYYGYALGGAPNQTVGPVSSVIDWSTIAGGTYTYAGHEIMAAPKTRVAIDPNVRVRGNGTYAGFEDVEGPVAPNEAVEVYEAESGLTGQGRVTDIDVNGELIYLSVDWSSLAEGVPRPPSSAPGQAMYMSAVAPTSEHDWTELSAQPSLAYVTLSGMTLQVTATAKGWWNENIPLESAGYFSGLPHPYVGLDTHWAVIA